MDKKGQINCGNAKCGLTFKFRSGKQFCCRKCKEQSKRNREIEARKKKRDSGITYLYYLPEHHYVGITYDLEDRLKRHCRAHGRIIEGWELIATFERRVDAHLVETMFHIRGYQGFQTIKTYEK